MVNFWWHILSKHLFCIYSRWSKQRVAQNSVPSHSTLHLFLSRRWGVHAAGCRPVGCWDAWWRGCSHLRQRPNGSPFPRGERAELRGTRHGLRCLLGALHKLPSSPPQSHLNWMCEHTLGLPVWLTWPPLVVQMTPQQTHVKTHTHTNT